MNAKAGVGNRVEFSWLEGFKIVPPAQHHQGCNLKELGYAVKGDESQPEERREQGHIYLLA